MENTNPLVPQNLGKNIVHMLNTEDTLIAIFMNRIGERLEITLPRLAVEVIAHVMTEIALESSSPLSNDTEIPESNLLAASHSLVSELLDASKITGRYTGTHRGIRDCLRAYILRESEARQELTAKLFNYLESHPV